jgi:nucleotide-binding universal stress UspA family protein
MGALFRKVLVPHDFSPHADAALGLALELARRARGRVLVLHVIPRFARLAGIPPGDFPPADVSAEMAADQARRLGARVAHRGRRGAPVDCRVVVGDPLAAILEAARGASAVVMGTLGRTGLAHLVVGSVAERVVRHSPVPVLTVRAGIRLRRSGVRSRLPSRRASRRWS